MVKCSLPNIFRQNWIMKNTTYTNMTSSLKDGWFLIVDSKLRKSGLTGQEIIISLLLIIVLQIQAKWKLSVELLTSKSLLKSRSLQSATAQVEHPLMMLMVNLDLTALLDTHKRFWMDSKVSHYTSTNLSTYTLIVLQVGNSTTSV